VDIRYAVGASLVSLMATSSGAAAAHRLAMPVMLGIVLGSLSGSIVLLSSGTRLLPISFAGVILIPG